MSSITGLSSDFGSQSLALAMTKRANDAQGQQAMQLLNGAAQSVQQIQAASPAASATGSLGANIDIKV